MRTSPGLTGCAAWSVFSRLTRTRPAWTSFAASERDFTTRAKNSHLSMRWRRSPAIYFFSWSLSAASLAKGESGSTRTGRVFARLLSGPRLALHRDRLSGRHPGASDRPLAVRALPHFVRRRAAAGLPPNLRSKRRLPDAAARFAVGPRPRHRLAASLWRTAPVAALACLAATALRRGHAHRGGGADARRSEPAARPGSAWVPRRRGASAASADRAAAARHRLGGAGDYRSDVGRRLRLWSCSGASALGGAETSASHSGLLHWRFGQPRLVLAVRATMAASAGSTTAGVSTARASAVVAGRRRFRLRLLFGSVGQIGAGYRRDIDDCRRFGLQRCRPARRPPLPQRLPQLPVRAWSISAIRALTAAAGLGIRAIAEALEDLLHVVGGGAEDRHHRRRDDEAAAVERAFGPRAGARLPGQRRADQVGQALENVDAHGAAAEHAEAGELVEGALEGRVDDDRGAAGGKRMDDVAEAGLVLAVILQRPQQRDEAGGAGLEQRRHEDVVGAEAHAEAAQRGAGFLVERLDVLGDVAAVEEAEILDELEGDAAADAGERVGALADRPAASAASRSGS